MFHCTNDNRAGRFIYFLCLSFCKNTSFFGSSKGNF
jgi:hypothetical protein